MTTILVTVVALYAALCVVVWATQERLVWFPGGPPTRTPRDAGLAFEDLQLDTRDGARVHAWFVPAAELRAETRTEPRTCVLVSHGNAGSIAERIELAAVFHEFGVDVLLYDYRGYGRSTGKLSEEGTYVDAECAYDSLIARGFAPASIVSYGESLGGAVAIELARRRDVGAVIVEDTFTSLPDVGASVYPWLPVRWLSRVRYASIDKVPALRVPLLIAHSPEDDLVPYVHGQRLFDAAREPKFLLSTAGGHNGGGFRQRAEWRERVDRFLRTRA